MGKIRQKLKIPFANLCLICNIPRARIIRYAGTNNIKNRGSYMYSFLTKIPKTNDKRIGKNK